MRFISLKFLPFPLLGALLLAPFISPFQASGEDIDPQRGRLADGRAFRVDPQGNEIVDYIAELELANEALKRQVYGLQTEVEQKTAALERSERGNTEVTERDLLSRGTVKPKMLEVEPPEAPSQQAELGALRAQRDSLLAELETLRAAKSQNENNTSNDEAQILLSRIVKLEGSLRKVEQEKSELSSRYAVAIERSDALAAELAKAESKGASLKEAESAKKEVLALRAHIETLNETVKARDAELKKAAVTMPASQGSARERVVDTFKSKLQEDLATLKSAIATRDTMFVSYSKDSTAVKFSPAKPVSERGIGVKEITGRLRAVTSVVELSALRRDIAEISYKVNEDVKLMERMNRLPR